MTPLSIAPSRASLDTGIFIRVKDGNRWVNADISQLDAASILCWLRSQGGDNPLAENVVGILLGRGHLHPVSR